MLMLDDPRWARIRDLIRDSRTKVAVSESFASWCILVGDDIDDPLKSSATFHAAWSAWCGGQLEMANKQRAADVSAWLEDDCDHVSPKRKS